MNVALEHVKSKQKTSKISMMSKYKIYYIMLLPAIVQIIIFAYLPMYGIIMAFQDFDVLKGINGSEFVGLKNFVTVLTLPAFLSAIKNTFVFSMVNLFFVFPFPIILALLLNELRHTWFKNTVQTISYLPHFLSWVSVIAIIYAFFGTEGTFNDFMMMIKHGEWNRINILMEPKYFLGIVYVSNVWKTIGWSAILYIAAITSVDTALYEASVLDGCGRFKQVLYITLPCIMPTIVITLILACGSLLDSNFEQIYGLQNIYTQSGTEVIDTLVYRKGIVGGEYSLTTAFGLMKGLVSFGMVMLVNKIAKLLGSSGLW